MNVERNPFDSYFEQREKSLIEVVKKTVTEVFLSGRLEPSPWLSKSQLGKYLDLSIPTIDKYVELGYLPQPCRLDRTLRFDIREVDKLLMDNQLQKGRHDFGGED